MKGDKVLNVALPIFTVCVIIGLWAIAAQAVNSEYVLPTVGETIAALFGLFKDAGFYRAFFGTFLRSAIAFSLSFLLAFITAFCAYRWDKAKRALRPLIVIVRALPTIAVVLLLVVWTNSRVAPVVVTMLVVFPTLYNNIYAAFSGIDKDLDEMCKAFGISRRKRILRVVLPQIEPELIAAAGAGLTLNLKLMVAAEVLSQTARSMGYLLNTAKTYFEIAEMLALVLITVAAGLIVEWAFSFWAKRAVKYDKR